MIITVFGLPAPQGSKRHVGHGVMIESSKKVKPWREAVKWAALTTDLGLWVTLTGAVEVRITFTMPKPKSAPKTRVTYPDRKPDIDKLCRSTFDALVEVGVIEDDARIILLSASKVFPGEGVASLPCPGAVITILKC